jgi:hypothetical protein
MARQFLPSLPFKEGTRTDISFSVSSTATSAASCAVSRTMKARGQGHEKKLGTEIYDKKSITVCGV